MLPTLKQNNVRCAHYAAVLVLKKLVGGEAMSTDVRLPLGFMVESVGSLLGLLEY